MKFDTRTINTIFIAILVIMLLNYYGSKRMYKKPKQVIKKESKDQLLKDLKKDMELHFLHNMKDMEVEYGVPERKYEYEINSYDDLYEGNTLGLENPVEPNNSIYGQNNLIDYFENDYSVPIKYTPSPESEIGSMRPSQTILNIDDNEFSVKEGNFNVEGYTDGNYATFSL